MVQSKMICPRCGVEMNLHAQKIDYAATPEEELAVAAEELGGVLEEIHTCPACGDTESRRAGDGHKAES